MLFTNNLGKKIVLGSGSPRRLELVQNMDLPMDIEVRVRPIDEVPPLDITGSAVAEWLAREKAKAQILELAPHEILITGDTVVVLDGLRLEKPTDADDATRMLQLLSGRTHTVATGVAVTTIESGTWSSLDEAAVTFRRLNADEIAHYVKHYAPFDKAGAYGIQEWMGAIGVERIEGSYYTIMGLPTHLLFERLKCS
jgi:septum formation protein